MGKFMNLNANNGVLKNLTRFQGFYDNIYREPLVSGGYAFLFITKPLLFIDPVKKTNDTIHPYASMAYLNMTRDPVFSQYLITEVLNPEDTELIKMLSYNNELFNSSFLPMFTNEFKDFSIDDVRMEQFDSFETKQGFKETLPTYKSASEGAGSFSVSVTEDSNMSFTKLMKLWVNYISNITDGTFDANPEMILNGTLDYTSSAFYFVLGEDGRTLKYWCKLTGCWPTTIPYSAYKYSRGSSDIVELNLNFNYSIREDMNPKILEEFNIISLGLAESSYIKTKTYINDNSTSDKRYSSIKGSALLNLDQLKNISSVAPILSSDERDPIIVFKDSSAKGAITADQTTAHFELIFDDYAYTSTLIEDAFGSDDSYFINDKGTNFLKNFNDPEKDWDETEFWK